MKLIEGLGEIESDIPPPSNRGGRPRARATVIAEAMQPGDSVACANRTTLRLIQMRLAQMGKRTLSSPEGGMYRIWCLEKRI
jgi:hypothetical protein